MAKTKTSIKGKQEKKIVPVKPYTNPGQAGKRSRGVLLSWHRGRQEQMQSLWLRLAETGESWQ